MCYGVRQALLAWIILLIISILLWYRDYLYDRAVAVFFIVVAFVQLLVFGYFNGADGSQVARFIFVLLWLQALVLNIGIFVSMKCDKATGIIPLIAGGLAGISGVAFTIAATYAILNGDNFTAGMDDQFCISLGEGQENSPSSTGAAGQQYPLWVILSYIMMIISSFILLLIYYWFNLGLLLIVIYLILTAAYIYYSYSAGNFPTLWNHLFIGVVFLAWLGGIFAP